MPVHKRGRKKKTKHTLLYRGVFACRSCKNAMIGERQRGHIYYRCHTKNCPSNSIRETAIDWQVLKALSRFELCFAKLKKLERTLLDGMSAVRRSLEAQKLAAAQVDAQLERLTDAYLEGSIDKDSFTSRKTTLEFQQAEARENYQKMQETDDQARHIQEFLEHAKSLARTYFHAKPAEKRQLLDLCFSNKFIFEKNVEIEPRDWLAPLLNRRAILPGAADDGNSRSGQKLEIPAGGDAPIAASDNVRTFGVMTDQNGLRGIEDLGSVQIQNVIKAVGCPDARRVSQLSVEVLSRVNIERARGVPERTA